MYIYIYIYIHIAIAIAIEPQKTYVGTIGGDTPHSYFSNLSCAAT